MAFRRFRGRFGRGRMRRRMGFRGRRRGGLRRRALRIGYRL